MRPSRRWMLALGGFVALVGVASIVVTWVTAGLQVQVDAYWSQFWTGESGPQAVEIDPVEDAYYSGLSHLQSMLGVIGQALILVAVCAGFLLLTLLAARSERRSV